MVRVPTFAKVCLEDDLASAAELAQEHLASSGVRQNRRFGTAVPAGRRPGDVPSGEGELNVGRSHGQWC